MTILNVQTTQVGIVGVTPSFAYISTDNTQTEILATGFLNDVVQAGTSFQMPCMAIVSTQESAGAEVKVGAYQVSNSGVNWSLVNPSNSGDIVLPTIANHIAVYTDVNGTLSEDAATAINGGNVQAGLSGTAGYLASFPSAASKGSFRVTAVANTGDTLTTLSNVAMGQASVVSIPDPVNAAARLLIGATATPFVSGNFPVASGTGGLMVDSGLAAANLQNRTNIKADRTANIGGAGAGPISVVVAGLTAASIVTASIQASSNPVEVQKVTATGTGFDILFSGDPGATCTVNYVAFVVAQ